MQQDNTTASGGLYRSEFEHDACGIGALANTKGHRTHQMVDDALTVLLNLEHRGGKGLERSTGDGAGILFQVPHAFFRKEAQKCGHILPKEGDYGVAMLFFPQDEEGVAVAKQTFEEGCKQAGLPFLFWREVPIDPTDLGATSRACMPTILQAFVGRPEDVAREEPFERRLYVCRRSIEKRAGAMEELAGKIFYACSFSSRTIVYKGMLVATQIRRFYPDLADANVKTAVALVHSRYSTNTTPSWERAHPNRFIIHNGEINTLKGNVNWLRAREPNLYSPALGSDIKSVLPIINKEGSDSAILDNVLEFLVMNGRSMTRAASMLLPEPWDHNDALEPHRRAFDEYQSMLMEPWDGPAAIVYTDGRSLGAALDRNGLRPARYYVTRDDRFLLASEVGVLDIEPSNILTAGCLGPGEMLEVNASTDRIRYNDQIRASLANEHPYGDWLREETVTVDALPEAAPIAFETQLDAAVPFTVRMAKLGYHFDDVDEVIRAMANAGGVPLASMGIDAPLACLSKKNRSFFDYFYQLFAQVTNPPIDALRESMVTSSVTYLGSHGNLLEDARDACRLIRLAGPMLTKADFERLASINCVGFKAQTFRAVYKRNAEEGALEEALEALAAEVEAAVRGGVNVVILSDRAATDEVPIPSLLATSSVHHHLIRAGVRTQADLIVESGDALAAHDFATLVGYSASAIYPYMAHECIEDLAARGALDVSAEQGIANYNKAVTAGITSIMSKMGISAVQSYQSAQIFEVVGLSEPFIDKHFTGTVSRVGGLGVNEIQREVNQRYDDALAILTSRVPTQLPSLGLTKWRPQNGEEHYLNPTTIYLLQHACQEGNYETFKEYSDTLHVEDRAIRLRDLLDFVSDRDPVPLEEVEPVRNITKRFNTGAMSYGSISEEAHKCMAIAMNRIGGRSNSGEGGEDPAREIPLENGDSLNSAIKQVASGRFGVTSRYLSSAIEIQIKMAQGAKPGEGGHLPGKKVYPWIAATRQSTPGIGLISPPPHHDIYSIEDLAELIFDLKNANPRARVSVKLVSEAGVGTIATGVAKGAADKILISGHNGGSGAAPRDSIWHAGLPLELGIAETQQTLLQNGLRSRVVLEADGKLMDGKDVAVACLLGAEEFGFATMPLIAMGCLMQRDCQQDTCPAGIATQNCRLRNNFHGKPEHVVNFMDFVAEQLREIMARLGFRTVDEMVGHPECLVQKEVPGNWKANLIDLSPVLANGECEFGAYIPGASGRHFLPEMAYDVELEKSLDSTLFLPLTKHAIETGEPVHFRADIANVQRCLGTVLGSSVTKAHPEGMADSTIVIDCHGSGGQSFGAFLPSGVTLNVSGDANDYFGKGLSGGILAVHPSEHATFKSDENIVIGNVAFYGATSGKGFINGLAGQRFGVRNSGATIVAEGVGNHGCEYMTGGTALILGEVGLNFAAGMTGGVAYVYDELGTLDSHCNKDMVKLVQPTEEEYELIHSLIEEHVSYTESARGIKMLYRFEQIKQKFVKVIPVEYERVLQIVADATAEGKTYEEARELAFEVVGKGH